MVEPPTGRDKFAELRREAEDRAREESRGGPEDESQLSAEEARRALHDLRVHQLELQMQNEELRRTQLELEASRERYYDLYDLAPVGYLTLKASGVIVQANFTAVDLLGVPRAQLIGRPLAGFIQPADQRAHYAAIREVLNTGARRAYEAQVRRPGGERIWARVEMIRSEDDAGKPSVRVALSDITEIKVAQARGREARAAELRASIARTLQEQRPLEDRFREVIDRMAGLADLGDQRASVFVLDGATGALTRLAGGAWQATGCVPDDLNRGECLCRMDDAAPGVVSCDECRSNSARGPGGDQRGGYAIPLAHVGQTLGLLCVAAADHQAPLDDYDLIQLRQIADLMALALANDRVRQQLERARHSAEDASRSKSAFLASMSHELRTPLNTILGTCDALLEGVYGAFNDKQANSIRNVYDSGHHLLKLINDILDLSRVEAGHVELELGRDSLDRVCAAALDMVRAMVGEKRLQVKLSVEGADHTVVADQRRLRQILVNLLSNAIKFTPEGGDVGIHAVTDAERRELRLTVWDSGIGIAPEEIERLFQPFVQLDNALSRRQTGAGLGLSLVKRMAELHGGRVTVESKVGEGSRFTVVLPWAPPAAGEDDESPIVWDVLAPDRHHRPQPPDGPLILLAEDNESNLGMLSDYLQAKGYRLAVARDGLEAVRLAHECRPDLVLMDVQLPRLDGLEAMRRIREAGDARDLPIVALTSAAMPGDRERCLAAGATDYFSKPISLRRLVEKVEDLLRRD